MDRRCLRLILFFLLVFLAKNYIRAQGINFEKGNFAESLQKAKAEKKYLFVETYATWCAPCKWLEKHIFSDSVVGNRFNNTFINHRLDIEKGEGPDFTKKHEISAYPTLLFFNPDGELIHKVMGSFSVEEILILSEDALDSTKQNHRLKCKYINGERTPGFLLQYINFMIQANEDPIEVVQEYLGSIKKEEWSKKENFNIIASTRTDLKSDIFKYVLSNRAVFEQSVGAENVESYIEMVYLYAITTVCDERNAAAYENLKADLDKNLGSKAPAMIAYLDLNFNMGTKNELKFADIYFDKYCNDAAMLNTFAWYYFENETNKTKLKAALKWAEKSVKLDKNWQNLDTRANLHFVLGNKKAALADAKEAVKMANEIGDDPSDTEALIKKIKK